MKHLPFVKPLAILLCLLLLPPELPYFGRLSLTRPAHAQVTVGPCAPGQNSILQVCDPRAVAFEQAELKNFEKDYNMKPGDGQLIYQYGRADLRMDFRAYLLTQIQVLIAKTPANRTATEQGMYDYVDSLVTGHEITAYQSAVNDRNLFLSNYCAWTPDLDIEGAYDVAMDVAAYCSHNASPEPPIFGGSPALPTKDYFVAKGMKIAYAQPIAGYPDIGNFQVKLGAAQTAVVAGVGAGFGAVAGGLWIAMGATRFIYAIFPKAAGAAARSAAVGIRSAAAIARGGLVAAVVVVIALIVVGSILAAEAAQERIQTLQGLDNDLANAQAHPVDLQAFIKTDVGQTKLTAVWSEISLPDYPSATALPTPGAQDPQFIVNGNTVSSVDLPDPNVGAILTLKPYGQNWVVGTGTGGYTATRFGNSINYVGPGGIGPVQYKAWLNNGVFLIVNQDPTNISGVICQASSDGLYHGNTAGCKSWAASSFQAYDIHGNVLTISMTQPPTFVSPAYSAWTTGASKTITLTAKGIPAPTFFISALPAGFSHSSPTYGVGTTTVQLTSNGTAPAGVYGAQFSISSGDNTISVSYEIDVETSVKITSPSSVSMTYGQPVNFTVTASGTQAFFKWDDLFPDGVTFTDNGDGTASITGTPYPTSKAYCSYDSQGPGGQCGIQAHNDVSSDFQVFKVYVNSPPAATIDSPSGTLFTAGQPGAFTVTQTGGSSYHIIDVTGDPLPAWLTEQLMPNGNLYLSGTPPLTTPAQTHTIRFLCPSLNGLPTPACSTTSQGFLLTTDTFPLFQDQGYIFLTPGAAVPSTKFMNANPFANFSLQGALPPGVSFLPNIGDFQFGGALAGNTPPGDYPVQINGTTPTGEASSESFHVVITKPPTYEGFDAYNFVVNQPMKLVLNPSGFPKNAAANLPPMQSGLVGTLPAGLSRSFGLDDGAMVLSGTPTATGVFPFLLESTNGVNPDLARNFTVRIIQPGDIDANGSVGCSDVSMVKSALNGKLGFAGYNNLADVNNDGIVNIQDLVLVTKHLPTGTKCP